jgi:CheY-like chemotaxis protein
LNDALSEPHWSCGSAPAAPLRHREAAVRFCDTIEPIVADAPDAPFVERRSPDRVTLDPATAARHPLRILVAEDTPILQTLVLRLLRQMGYEPDLAHHGLEALDFVSRATYDVILMDMDMPEMGGVEATRRIRSMNIPQPRIIAVTSNTSDADRQRCTDAGMDDHVAKPIRVPHLLDALITVTPRTRTT